ncbi:hypothetical protein [Corallococcus sp. 4LFB]|uniref:hypothetical protein n=1 Tax=Corallococcus sp. 4LFB TaxID=3383249 RepID=UPI003974A78B
MDPQAGGYVPQAPAEQDSLNLSTDDIDIPSLSEPAPWMPQAPVATSPAAAPAEAWGTGAEEDFSGLSVETPAPVAAAAPEPSLEDSFADLSMEVESEAQAPATSGLDPMAEALASAEQAAGDAELLEAEPESEAVLAEDLAPAPMDAAWDAAPLAVESEESRANALDTAPLAVEPTASAEGGGADWDWSDVATAEPAAPAEEAVRGGAGGRHGDGGSVGGGCGPCRWSAGARGRDRARRG